MRRGRAVEARPESGAIELVSVTVLPLQKRYRSELWPRVVPELDRVATALAQQEKAVVTRSRTIVLSGRRARDYQLARGGVVERLAFVLRAKRNYQLYCRFERGNESEACGLLFRTFRLG